MELKARLTSLLLKYQFRQSPVLDQYFVTDFGVLEREVRYLDPKSGDKILEVGTGTGFLTELVARTGAHVTTIEKDKRLEPILKEELVAKHANINLVMGDALEVKWPAFNKFVSNAPYSISAPLIFKLLEHDFELAIVSLQKEFAE